MLSLVSVLALTGAALLGPTPAEPKTSYLFRMTPKDGKVEFSKEVFQPREGDIVLYDDHNPFVTRLFKIVGTDSPLHAGIVFKKADGTPTLIEAGANFVPKVATFDVHDRFHNYDGTVMLRRLKAPLTAEQSKKLTDFCVAQDGKTYAVGRLLLQGTPVRPRTKIFSPFTAKTSLDRDRWICSELVVAACSAAAILDGKTYPANALYPRDLTYDEQIDISATYERPALWYQRAELEFVGGAIRVPMR